MLDLRILLTRIDLIIYEPICRWDIPAFLESWVTNTPSVKMSCPKRNCLYLYFRKNMTCLSVDLLMTCKVFSVSCKTAYRWIMTNCCFMRGIQQTIKMCFRTTRTNDHNGEKPLIWRIGHTLTKQKEPEHTKLRHKLRRWR